MRSSVAAVAPMNQKRSCSPFQKPLSPAGVAVWSKSSIGTISPKVVEETITEPPELYTPLATDPFKVRLLPLTVTYHSPLTPVGPTTPVMSTSELEVMPVASLTVTTTGVALVTFVTVAVALVCRSQRKLGSPRSKMPACDGSNWFVNAGNAANGVVLPVG